MSLFERYGLYWFGGVLSGVILLCFGVWCVGIWCISYCVGVLFGVC